MTLKEKLNLPTKPVFLMDGTAFFYRSFFAQRNLARSDGFPTNALTLLTRVLLRILRIQHPDHFLFVMDGRGKNFRHELYNAYKANREAMPEALAMQRDPVCHMVEALGIPLHITVNCEADDCIASLAHRFSSQFPVIIISGDKDLKQCLSPNIFMWDPGQKEEKLLTMDEFSALENVRPDQWPDVQALIGDSSDNIPGVPGIGPKTAQQIFEYCENLEDIRDNLAKLPQKLQTKLAPELEKMFLWRQLARLRFDACPDLTLKDLSIRPINLPDALAISREFELTAIGREITQLARIPLEPDSPPVQAAPPIELPEPISISTDDQLPTPDMAATIIWQNGLKKPPIVASSESSHAGKACKWLGDMAALCIWAAESPLLIVPDFKLLLVTFPEWRKFPKFAAKTRVIDLALASWILSPGNGDYSFLRLAATYEETHGPALPSTTAIALGTSLESRLENAELLDLYLNLECPLIPVLAEMQLNGIAIDPIEFKKFLDTVEEKIEELTNKIFQAAGEKFNLRSSRKLGSILFEKLGLPLSKTTKGGQPSTSQTTLEGLAADYPIIEDILEFRKFEKLRSTYLEPLLLQKDKDNRLHSTFNQCATATGRISSSDPNLQNIPVRGELGQKMRACFVAAPGHLLVAADYSQIELRVLAHLSQDENLLAAFRDGADIHARTAALVFETDPHHISADQRRMAKTINFGLLYGMGPRKLAQELKITLPQARDFINKYFASLSGLKAFYDRILDEARTATFVHTMTGRKRWLPQIHSANGNERAQAERQAINTVIQGSAADIMKLAMLAVAHDESLKRLGAKMVLQVHDELLLETPAENAKQTAELVVAHMQNATPAGAKLSVPLVVDWGIGHNWAEAH